MIQKFTKGLLFTVLALMLLTVNQFTFAAGKMKDIELDPGKADNHGNMMKTFPTIASNVVTTHFYFENDGMVKMEVFDMQGRILDGTQGYVPQLRTHEVTWDASTTANGTYFVKLSHADGTVLTSKVIVRH